MIFAILTLLTALSLAAVAGWFSIIGIMAIYAGSPIHALVAGIVIECGKLTTVSWLYRNWKLASWKILAPLVFLTTVIMSTTSIGVYGFLAKAHLEQGSSTLDNTAKVTRLEEQISQEKTKIVDNQKVIDQMDSTIKSYIDAGSVSRSVSVRNRQRTERDNLRKETDAIQKRIDELSQERFVLQSEVRKVELEVGPIRYIAELMYGVADDARKNIEAAIRIFSSMIVLSLDPLAVALLIAANHTIIRIQNEKNTKTTVIEQEGKPKSEQKDSDVDSVVNEPVYRETKPPEDTSAKIGISSNEVDATTNTDSEHSITETQIENKTEIVNGPETEIHEEIPDEPSEDLKKNNTQLPILRSPKPSFVNETSQVQTNVKPWMHQGHILEELIGSQPNIVSQEPMEIDPIISAPSKKNNIPVILGWLDEFKRK